MFRDALIFCALCTASVLVSVKGQNGKMRILPGLTFYHADESITQPLNEDDRNLLNTVLGIISRPEMQKVLEDLQSTIQNNEAGPPGAGGGAPEHANGNGWHGANGGGSGSVPIATINVYPGYPGGPMGDPRVPHNGGVDAGPEEDDDGATNGEAENGEEADDEGESPVARRYVMADNFNEIRDAPQINSAEESYANTNYAMAHDNYFDASSALHHLLPALSRRSLSKKDQKDMLTSTQIADLLGQRRLLSYDKPSSANHYNSFLFPGH